MSAFRTLPRIAAAGCCAAVLCMLIPSPLLGNIGPQWHGDVVADPQGLIGVDIIREKLTIDLRPVAALQHVEVEAVYHLRNPGPEKKLELLFVSGALGVKDFEVRLDDQSLIGKDAPLPLPAGDFWQVPKMPESWRPDMTLPGFDGKGHYGHIPGRWGALVPQAFSVVLPPGTSTLTARYHARACGTDEMHLTATWAFPYILAPARSWKSFGGLDVTVYVPAGWEAISAPALEREGDVLHGSFDDLPADVLTPAVRAPLPPGIQETIDWYVNLHHIAIIGGGVLCCLAGVATGWGLAGKPGTGRNRGLWLMFFIALVGALAAFLWAAAIFQTARTAFSVVGDALGGQACPYWIELVPIWGWVAVLMALAALPVGFLLTCSCAYFALDRAKPRISGIK